MSVNHYVLLAALVAISASQRSPYAGRRPIGFPVIETTTLANTQNDTLGDRFGEGQTTTTQRLPIEALGDRQLVLELQKLPQDKQPFWLVNWQALEQNRNKPQSYPLRPNIFAGSLTFPLEQPARNFANTQQPLQNNQGFINAQPPAQNNQGVISNQQQPIPITQSRVQDQGLSNQQQLVTNTQFPVQGNQGLLNNQQQQIPNTQLPIQNNQGLLNNQQTFQNDADADDEFDYE